MSSLETLADDDKIHCDLVVCRLAQVASAAGTEGPVRGAAMDAVEVIEGDVWIASMYGEIVAIGHGYEIRDRLELADGAEVIDAHGMVAVPGLIDCHTHACFAGDRVAEFDLRVRGASYEEIHAAGGGILSTVRATREATQGELLDLLSPRLTSMLEHGTTAVEVKSGYGLSFDGELMMLRAIEDAYGIAHQRVNPTVLAAHAVPPEADDADMHIATCVGGILPEVSEWALARQADIFLERGAFDVEQSRRYLLKAKELGLTPRLHGDQFSEMGAIDLAIEVGARSVDHLEATKARGVAKLAKSDVAAVLLPTAALTLNLPMPPGRALIDKGAIVALATDFNPGSSPCDSLPTVMHLACTQLHLSPAEALTAVTANAAHVLELEDVGRLRVGQRADIVIVDAPDWRYLAYRLGTDAVKRVIIDGTEVYES